VHFGVILPNYGLDSNPDEIRRTSELAEELGFDSVWATEHIIVGPEGHDPYGRVYAPLVTLAWIAGFTSRVALGTSIILVPLHHPILLAKEVATLQGLSRRRFLLGVGMGWHKDEYDFMGVPFEGRGRRGDVAIQLIRKVWSGEAFPDAMSEPRPSPQPEIWVGGGSEGAIKRALELGGVWHPSRSSNAEDVRRVKAEHPHLRVIPRVAAENVDAMLDAGAEGAIIHFANDDAMREFAKRLA
jgi:alkanesulfonate monooxygenase SsuD/methylene tetrahydromethanopterin reductase-like flavin-dependent oxidoreductase (luciferase family)